jgi:hypothetical protein
VEKVLNSIAENEMQDSLEGLRLLSVNSMASLSLEAPSAPSAEDRTVAICTPLAQTSTQALTRQFEKTHALTNVQLLDLHCTRISQESYALNFDYFALHERCMVLLKALYEEFKQEIVERDGELDWKRG